MLYSKKKTDVALRNKRLGKEGKRNKEARSEQVKSAQKHFSWARKRNSNQGERIIPKAEEQESLGEKSSGGRDSKTEKKNTKKIGENLKSIYKRKIRSK